MWHDLSQPFGPAMDHSTALAPPEFRTERTVAEDGARVTHFDAPTHAGTHVDAPAHVLDGGATLDDLPLDAFAGEAVVLDVPCESARELGPDDLRAGGEVRGGDVVLVHTGWGEKQGTEAYYEYPWLSASAAEWLVERGVKLLGTDTLSPDEPRSLRSDGGESYPVHRRLLEAGVPIAENLRLSAVAGRRVEVVGFPLRIEGGDGAPTRFVART
ncbi:cyclase family protein [Halomarina litorea]|uniref:cyclase family protein n=1 Tax=Halomarina litorea TaxID=2961595 RepID=UPI0020C52D1F|nr:cyclase family protein [Halomarina sp. BCD28]